MSADHCHLKLKWVKAWPMPGGVSPDFIPGGDGRGANGRGDEKNCPNGFKGMCIS
jgi:hypothetical protein